MRVQYWWRHRETAVAGGRARNPTTLPSNPICINPEPLAEPDWELTASSLAVPFYPTAQSRGGKYLVCHQYSPLLWPQQTSAITHTLFHRVWMKPWEPFSAQLFKAATANQSDRRADKTHANLISMPWNSPTQSSQVEKRPGMPDKAYCSSRCLRSLCSQGYHLPDYLFLLKDLEREVTLQLTSPRPPFRLESLLRIPNKWEPCSIHHSSWQCLLPLKTVLSRPRWLCLSQSPFPQWAALCLIWHSASELHFYLLGLYRKVSFGNRRISECLSMDSRPSEAGLTYHTSYNDSIWRLGKTEG